MALPGNLPVTQLYAPDVFWGRTFPRIYLYDTMGRMIRSWTFSRDDHIDLEIYFRRVIDSREEMEDGTIRERRRGWRLMLEIEIRERVGNRLLMDFLRVLHDAPRIEVQPHPNQMFQRGYNDTFVCILDSDWEYEYLAGRWIGHIGTLRLIGNEILDTLPVQFGQILPMGRTIIPVKGSLFYRQPPVAGVHVCSTTFGIHSIVCTTADTVLNNFQEVE